MTFCELRAAAPAFESLRLPDVPACFKDERVYG